MLDAVTADEHRPTRLLREVAEEWDLRLGDPFASGQASIAAAVRLRDAHVDTVRWLLDARRR